MKNVIKAESLNFVINAEKNNKGADFTIKSLVTGKDYTYAISRSRFNGKWYTHVKVEQEYQRYVRLGSYFKGKIYNKGAVVETPSAVAIAWVLAKVEEAKFDLLNEKVEVMHTGCCLRCGKTLTDAKSIESGLGPICRGL